MTPDPRGEMMHATELTDVPDWLWERAAAARSRLLMLDYDGTLAEFRLDREHAFPSRPMLALLGRIRASDRTRIAIISGRPIAELDRLLGPIGVPMIGEHGWESRLPGGQMVQHPLSDETRHALEWAAMVICREPWAGRLEPKRTGLLVHTRGLEREEAARIEARCARLWSPVIAEDRLRLSHVSSGVELRAPGRHKGSAAKELMADALPGTFSVYIGDDETDEDAFRAVLGAGAGLLVAAEKRATLASGRLGSIAEVMSFLQRWHTRLDATDGVIRPPPRQERE